MAKKKNKKTKGAKRTLQLERVVKGFANHRRIEIMELLAEEPEVSVQEIAELLEVDYQTVAQHTQKLAAAGLVMKRHDGTHVRHALTPKGKRVLKFLTALE